MATGTIPNHETRHSGPGFKHAGVTDPESSGFLLDTGFRRYDEFFMCFTRMFHVLPYIFKAQP